MWKLSDGTEVSDAGDVVIYGKKVGVALRSALEEPVYGYTSPLPAEPEMIDAEDDIAAFDAWLRDFAAQYDVSVTEGPDVESAPAPEHDPDVIY